MWIRSGPDKVIPIQVKSFPKFFTLISLIILLTLSISLSSCSKNQEQKTNTVSVIYTTDLFHPPGDMDDQIDLAVLFVLEQIDIRAVVLDNTETQNSKPGAIPLKQINYLTDRQIPFATGLSKKLKSQEDTGENQPDESQDGVQLILQELREAEHKVTLVTVGSVRDIAASYNRDEELFRKKVDKIYIFAGEASKAGFLETNVKKDIKAFVRIMNSGLPIVWIPCFDGGLWHNKGRASYWRTTYAELLGKSSDKLRQYFIYSYKKLTTDPIEHLTSPIDPNYQRKLFKKPRNLWCCSVFLSLMNQRISLSGNSYNLTNQNNTESRKNWLFDFEDISVRFNDTGEAVYGDHPDAHTMSQFRVKHPGVYGKIMTQVAADLLSNVQ